MLGLLLHLTTCSSTILKLYQTSLGLEYLHKEGIVHADLHAGNILVDKRGSALLTDFGLALIADGTAYNYGSHHGELFAPEDFGLDSGRPTFSSDIYAFACLFIEKNSLSRNHRSPHPTPRSQRRTSTPTIAFGGRSHVDHHPDSFHTNTFVTTDNSRRRQAPAVGGRVSSQGYVRCGVTPHHHPVGRGSKIADLLPGHLDVGWLRTALARTETFHNGGPTGPRSKGGKGWLLAGRPSNIKSSERRSSCFSCSEIYVKIYEVLVAEPQTLQRIPAVHQPDLNALGARPLKRDYDLDSTPLLVVLASINGEMHP
ncbi:hypothetical protein EIP91_000266 [Steccherinum ochraceum]|uniref:Protein kinase domain-containing protein n=1 Tax=Steccherinum ochraceum TaxID=92696 RepID=A0A4R0RMU3_9APHY|nr:hypothetical protein EIP91_000266 [Steccherinum ochraceum]